MIATNNLTLSFGHRVLFEDVSIKFTPGNCYGLIGANGAGKSTFIKILSGEIDSSAGDVVIPGGLRMSVLRQDHFAFDEEQVLTTVLRGHDRLFKIMKEKEEIYAKDPFTEEDGNRAGELEQEFADLSGWEAEAQAGELLGGLGIPVALHDKLMKDIDDNEKVRVLLAQALFGDPDILLLDEPTNHLDVDSILWLEEFLYSFQNTVIVVSHDRHFLNKVCTHIADIDFSKVQLYTGNYDFWRQSSDLALKQKRDANKKSEDKAKELKAFIARFSANASKSRQATSRRKLLEKLDISRIQPSTRKYPHIVFDPEKLQGRELLTVKDLSKTIDGVNMFEKISFNIGKGERVVFVSDDSTRVTALLDVLSGNSEPDSGTVKWGVSVRHGYFPKEHGAFFDTDLDLVDWLRQFSEDQTERFVRTFLGRMLFTGDESKKAARVLSGGEKVRCMLSRLMLENPHVLIMDGPTNHLDLESITALNDALKKFKGTLMFASHDVEFISTLADRIIRLDETGFHDRHINYDEYLNERAEKLGLPRVA